MTEESLIDATIEFRPAGESQLVMATRRAEGLLGLRRLFAVLANGERTNLRLDAANVKRMQDLAAINLIVADIFEKTAIANTPDGGVVDWSLSPEGWLEKCEQIDGLLTGCGHGHQYLAGFDSSLEIKLSFREPYY